MHTVNLTEKEKKELIVILQLAMDALSETKKHMRVDVNKQDTIASIYEKLTSPQ